MLRHQLGMVFLEILESEAHKCELTVQLLRLLGGPHALFSREPMDLRPVLGDVLPRASPNSAQLAASTGKGLQLACCS